MKKKSLLQLRLMLVGFIVLFAFTGCTIKKMELTETGFLSGYSGLEEDEALEGLRVYKNSGVNINERYSKVIIAPIQFQLDPTVKEHDMAFEDRWKLSEYFRERLTDNLSKNYEITEKPGEGVLLFRAAVTDVLPNKVYLNLHWSTTMIGGGIGGASLEAEVVDSITNERIMSFVDARKGKKLNYTKGLTKWGHTQEVLGMWADIMAESLDQLRSAYAEGTTEDSAERE